MHFSRSLLSILLATASAVPGAQAQQARAGGGEPVAEPADVAGPDRSTLTLTLRSHLFRRSDHDAVARLGQPSATLLPLQRLRVDAAGALSQKLTAECGANRPPASQQYLLDAIIGRNTPTLDRIRALDEGVGNAAAANALATQGVAVLRDGDEAFVSIEVPACIAGGRTGRVSFTGENLTRAHWATLQLGPQTRAFRLLARDAVRMVSATNNAECGPQTAGLFPFDSADIWTRYQQQRALLPAGVAPRSAIIGIIDRGVQGPQDPQFPETTFARLDGPDPYGSDADGTNIILPISNDPERDHGTGVADLASGGAAFRRNAAAADAAPIQLRVYSIAGQKPDFKERVATDGVDYLLRSGRAYDPVRPSILNLSFEQDNAAPLWGRYTTGAAFDDPATQEIAKGVLYVAAAGNKADGAPRGRDLDNPDEQVYPAALGGPDKANVVTVAALDRTGRLASFSNFGADSVDIAAPGCRVRVLDADQHEHDVSGTSFAAPQVSLAAALVSSLSARPPTSAQIKERLILSADYSNRLERQGVHHGATLNIARAMSVNSDVFTLDGRIVSGSLSDDARDLLAGTCQTERDRRIVAKRTDDGAYEITRYYAGAPGNVLSRDCPRTERLPAGALLFVDASGQSIDLASLPAFDVLLRP